MTPGAKSYLYALTVVVFWSTVASAFKLSLRYLSVVELLFYATLTATLVLFLILALQRKLALLKGFRGRDYLFSILMGFLNPFVYYLAVFKAYELLPAQQAQPLNMIWGIVLVLVAVPFLKQSLRFDDMAALGICFLGVMVISTEGSFSTMRITNAGGVLLAVGSSVIFSLYWVLNVRDKKDTLVRLLVNFGAGSLFILPLFILQARVPPLAGLAGAVYVGLFEMGLAFFFWVKALKLAKRTVNIAILIYLVPFISFVFIHLLVGETILISSVVGALLIVLGTFINKYRELTAGKNKTGKI